MTYLTANAKNPYMGLDNKICKNPTYWCRLHQVWLSDEDVKRKKCKNKPTFDMIGVHRCGCLEGRKKLRRKYTIYAVDFDGTLCESAFPGIGSPNMALIGHLIKRRKQGNKIILWTCRVEERLKEAVEWCRSYGLEFDAVNKNLPEMIEQWGGESRKVFADVYIDDKAVNKPKYRVPYKAPKLKITVSEGAIKCKS